ncbi:MAG TPA: allantoicase, partial [Xanthomonadales bacterium]|nr:allantoicase [Xanthomonadales bacterium]
DHGKWMDGWESRRKRVPGHDFCIIRLCPGVIHGIEIDTRFFTGNFPPQAALEVCNLVTDPDDSTMWTELLPKVELQGNTRHYFEIDDENSWSHARFHIYPDGGVARLRLYGVASFDWNSIAEGEWADLVAMQHGGRALAANDMHYGHMSNLLAPGDGVNMGDGWETRRRREPGNDWVILKLGHPGCLKRILVDTAFFKGNYPARCSLHGALLEDVADEDVHAEADYWQPVLPPVELGPDQKHVFEMEVLDAGRISHVRLDIYPDGGVSRLLLYGDWRC